MSAARKAPFAQSPTCCSWRPKSNRGREMVRCESATTHVAVNYFPAAPKGKGHLSLCDECAERLRGQGFVVRAFIPGNA